MDLKTIILPGYSPRNKDWAESVAKDIANDVVVHNWKHWTGGSMSVKHEIGEIIKRIGKRKVNIIAKSVGTRIAMKLVDDESVRINKLVLCGVPIEWKGKIADTDYVALNELNPKDVLIIQNTKDPLGNYSVIKKFIDQISPSIEIVRGDRSDHHYPNSEEIKKFLVQ